MLIGPHTIRASAAKEPKYKAECLKCGWTITMRSLYDAEDALMVHGVDEHLMEETLEERMRRMIHESH